MPAFKTESPVALDGHASPGVSFNPARADHKHPIDIAAIAAALPGAGIVSQSALDAEATARIAADNLEIRERARADTTLTDDLAAEVTRAEAAEGVLTTNLAAEVTRAEAAEGVLTTNLAAEVTRAEAAEGVLTTALAAEVTRAEAAEGAAVLLSKKRGWFL